MKKKFVTVADFAQKMEGMTDEQKAFVEKMLQLTCDVVNKSREGDLTPEEVEDKFKSINDQLKAFDAEKFNSLIKDNEELVTQVKQLGETVKKLKERGLSNLIVKYVLISSVVRGMPLCATSMNWDISDR